MRRTGASLVLIAALAAVACGGGEHPNAPAATDNQPRTAATSTLSSTARPLRVERLECPDGGMFPATALTAGWRRRSVTAGPLTFYYARDLARQPAAAFAPGRTILRGELRRARDPRVRRRIERTLARMPRDGLGIAELLVLVEPGAKAATAVVPPAARRRLALVYSRRARDAERPGAAGIIRLGDGDRAVRFASCHGERWQYLGGIIANRPGCVPIDVRVGAGRPLRRYLPLGTGRQHCGP
jgi:hypothetical protein